MHERKIIPKFLVIPCRNAFRGILGRSFLSKLDVISFIVHLKVTYHDREGRLTTVSIDLEKESGSTTRLEGYSFVEVKRKIRYREYQYV